jgi:hypothetical protein
MFVLQKPAVLDERLAEAKKSFADFIRCKNTDDKKALWPYVIRNIGDAPLSECFELYMRVFFEHVFTSSKDSSTNFLTLVENLHLNKMARAVYGQFQDIFDAIQSIDLKIRKVRLKSYSDLSKMEEEYRSLKEELQESAQIIEFCLSGYLLAVQGVLFLEKKQLITAEKEIAIKNLMLTKPKETFRQLMSLIEKISFLNLNNDAKFMAGCQGVFKELLTMFSIDDGNDMLAEAMYHDLFETGFIMHQEPVSTPRP